MKKVVVLKLDVYGRKCKQKAMEMASNVPGLESISMDTEEKKLTLTGDIDAVVATKKLRKVYHAEIEYVGPVNEPNKNETAQWGQPNPETYMNPHYYAVPYYERSSVEDYPNCCVIS